MTAYLYSPASKQPHIVLLLNIPLAAWVSGDMYTEGPRDSHVSSAYMMNGSPMTHKDLLKACTTLE